MIGYIVRRVLLALLTIWAISVVSFVIIQLPPGDIMDAIQQASMGVGGVQFAGGTALTDEEIDDLRRLYGFDRPQYVQYLKWITRTVQGDLGYSYKLEVPIKSLIGDRLLFTVVLALATIVFTWLLAIPIGIYSAVRQRSAGDYFFTFLGFTGLAVPDFLLALVMLHMASVTFGMSVGGLFSIEYADAPWSLAKLWDMLKHLWIPAVVIGTAGTASLIRIMRANLLDELRRPYVVTARAKGMSGWRLILKYPVRVALNPLVSVAGYLLPRLISGSIIVSVVLSLPTLGPLLLNALLDQDTFLAGTIVFFLGVLTVIGTLISDILLSVVDPRIRLVESAS